MAGMSTAGLAAAQAGEGWHYVGETDEPAFNSGWSNAGGGLNATAFRFHEPGIVDIYVGVNVGTGSSPFTLPDGYRPSATTGASGSGLSLGGTDNGIYAAVNTAGVVNLDLPSGSTLAVFIGSFWLDPPTVIP